jgi:FMN-dependent NADH-azoreductase
MKNILQINSSIYNGKGESSKLAGEFVAQLRVGNAEAKVVVRDVAKNRCRTWTRRASAPSSPGRKPAARSRTKSCASPTS